MLSVAYDPVDRVWYREDDHTCIAPSIADLVKKIGCSPSDIRDYHPLNAVILSHMPGPPPPKPAPRVYVPKPALPPPVKAAPAPKKETTIFSAAMVKKIITRNRPKVNTVDRPKDDDVVRYILDNPGIKYKSVAYHFSNATYTMTTNAVSGVMNRWRTRTGRTDR
jgi:hypothetical protein